MSHDKNGMSFRVIFKLLHTLSCQFSDEPLVDGRDYSLPTDGCADVKCLFLFAGETGALMLMTSCFWPKHVLRELGFDELTDLF